MEMTRLRVTRIVLAAAHLDNDPTNNRLRNLRALCQRCHILYDRPHHLAQRWITYRRRLATGDLFLGPYPALILELTSKRTGGSLWGGQHSRPISNSGSCSGPERRSEKAVLVRLADRVPESAAVPML
jgi:hypothetical protein